MTFVDRGLLLVTGLIALYLCVVFYRNYKAQQKKYNLYYLITFAVLLVAGLLLIVLTYDVLANPLVVIVSALIPLSLAQGLVTQYYPKNEKNYLVFAVIGLLAIAVTRFIDSGVFGTIVLTFFHSIAGLTVFFIPIIAVKNNNAPKQFVFVTIGGTLIGIGGIALSFLKTGKPLLFFTADVIFLILAPILLLMAASFAYGFIKGSEPIPPENQKFTA